MNSTNSTDQKKNSINSTKSAGKSAGSNAGDCNQPLAALASANSAGDCNQPLAALASANSAGDCNQPLAAPASANSAGDCNQPLAALAVDCCAVLLRGGRSRRMGRDKALLPWQESTFVETIASKLDFLEEKYLSVASREAAERSEAEDGLSPDWIRLPDLLPDRGPLGGIYTGLSACRAEWVLIASCDIPAVEQSFFTMLLENRADDVDIVYPRTPDGRMHMTCALYRKSIAPIVRQQLEAGDNRLRVLTDQCRAKEIMIDRPDLVRMISNFNTEEEMQAFLQENRSIP